MSRPSAGKGINGVVSHTDISDAQNQTPLMTVHQQRARPLLQALRCSQDLPAFGLYAGLQAAHSAAHSKPAAAS